MANKPLNGVLKHVRKLAAIQAARSTPDHELLQRFVASDDETALTVLIERHGPMVFGVCRRALRCVADAEDAFQATFLVFSSKAASIRKSASLGSWLHGVALRVAAKLKREIARRKLRERAAVPPPTRTPADEVSWAEVQTVLDEELQSLPERYRAVLILCYLDGKTRDEAAKQLCLTLPTLHGLLERGRKLLADRLTRRGLTLSAGLLGMAVEGVAGAVLSSTQVLSTAHAAALFAAGQPVGQLVPVGVVTLSQQVLKGMIMTKLKLVSAVLFSFVLLASVIGFTFAQTGPDKKQPAPQGWTTEIRGYTYHLKDKDTDEAFIRRLSKDLRGVEPTPAEIHFFVTSKEGKKREKLVDLFIAEREAKKKAEGIEFNVRVRAMETLEELALLDIVKHTLDAKKAAPASPNVALLRTNVQLAKLAVEEKALQLKSVRDKYIPSVLDTPPVKAQIELLDLDLRRARLLLEQAELELTIAEQKSPAK